MAAWILRRKPEGAAGVILVLWIMIPSVAGQLLTGVSFSSATVTNMHPAAWFTYVFVCIFAIVGPQGWIADLKSTPWLLVLLAWLMAYGAISTFTNVGQASPRGFVGNFLAGGLWLFICAVGGARNQCFALRLLKLFVACAVVNGLLSIVQSVLGEVWPFAGFRALYQVDFRDGAERTSGTLDHPLVLSLLMVAALPLAMVLRGHWVRLGAITVLLIGLLQSGSRAGALLGLIGLLGGAMVSRQSLNRKLAQVIGIVGTASALLLAGAGEVVISRFVDDDGSTSLRQEAYAYFWENLSDILFVGGGYASSFDLKDRGLIPSSFENGYVMLATDMGLMAAASFLGVQVGLLVVAWRRAVPRAVLVGAAATMACAATFSSFQVLSAAMIIVWAPIAVAACWPDDSWSGCDNTTSSPKLGGNVEHGR
ncbi:O-antigen ligase family protein [Geodermatophilus marinus]|uniref:O-antigen ligase family protein n=1 Tax=Geodermatophilus sp. LHW52908 TaxID=2303986 RepID=UPI0011C1CC4A|nr:hypothetical protein [Geodermatophilus sp. LHW52908]